MGCNRDRRSEKTRGMFHYLTKRPPNVLFYGKQRPSSSKLSHKKKWQDNVLRVNNISPQSSRTCVLVYATATSYSEEEK